MNKKVEFNIESFADNKNIGFLTLNNPPVNSLSIDVIDNMNDIIDNLSKDIKVLVFKSKGRGFCAGADLKERSLMNDEDTIKIVDRYKRLFNKIDDTSCPTIAAIHGYALGGGLEFALACDFRFATADSVLGFPETSLGIIPGAGGTQRLSRLVGVGKAKKWIFTADKFSAKEAFNDDVIDKMFDNENLMSDYINKMVSKFSQNSQLAISLAKKSINYASGVSLDKGLIFEREQYLKTLKDPVRLESLKKFKK